MSTGREQTIEQMLVQRVKSIGGICVKFIPDNRVGMPDRIVLLPDGEAYWVELKRPKSGRLSEIQKYRHRELESLGQRVRVLWSADDVDKFLREVM